MEKLVLNGTLIDRGEASVDIEDRGYQFGDGIYEVVRVYGGRLFTSEMHLKRLYQSAEKLSLHIPYTMEQLTAQLEALVAANRLDTGIVYLQFTRGVAKRKHHFPETSETTFVAYTSEMERPLEKNEKRRKSGACGRHPLAALRHQKPEPARQCARQTKSCGKRRL